jgi:hypothetical protein
MGKGVVTPVESGRETLIGDAVARTEKAAMRIAFVYILVVCWAFGRVVEFDASFQSI